MNNSWTGILEDRSHSHGDNQGNRTWWIWMDRPELR